jgi:predicted Zn-dependent peptidase
MESDDRLVVRRRELYGLALWYVGRGSGKAFTPYTDERAPDGYAFMSKSKAEKIAAEIEARIKARREALAEILHIAEDEGLYD